MAKKSFLDRVSEFGDKIHKRTKEIANQGRLDQKTVTEGKKGRAEAYYRKKEGQAMKLNAKANYRRAQADKIQAKQGYKKTAARMAAISSVASSMGNAAQSKYSNKALEQKYKSESAGLIPWQELINNKSEAASGTGESNPGSTSGGKTTTENPTTTVD